MKLKVSRDVPTALKVAGFRFAGTRAGIKRRRNDVAVIAADGPCAVASVFTKNAVKAAPVLVSQDHLATGDIRALVLNSGNANACTGEQGRKDAVEMCEITAKGLGLRPEQVLVASTGIIGRPMPMDLIRLGIKASLGELQTKDSTGVVEAIMTTDTTPKAVRVKVQLSFGTVTIGGIAKGSGMIHPNMGTMLAFLLTDAKVAPDALTDGFRDVVDRTFNMITVDGDTSTNDMATLFASGRKGSTALAPGSKDWEPFLAAVEEACKVLAKAIAADGEGATRLIEVRVQGAPSETIARELARTVAGSSLVKSAIHGGDPNWGRIVAALGRAWPDLDVAAVSISLGGASPNGAAKPTFVEADDQPVVIVSHGVGIDVARLNGRATAALKPPLVIIGCVVGDGPAGATAWGCDLSAEYVHINACYTT